MVGHPVFTVAVGSTTSWVFDGGVSGEDREASHGQKLSSGIPN